MAYSKCCCAPQRTLHRKERKTLLHTNLHLLVGILQGIALQHRIILLDGKVAALIEYRKCGGHLLWRHIEVIDITTFLLDVQNVDMIMFQSLDEVTWRSRTKPIRSYLLCIQNPYQTERIEDILRFLAEMITIITCFAIISHSLCFAPLN